MLKCNQVKVTNRMTNLYGNLGHTISSHDRKQEQEHKRKSDLRKTFKLIKFARECIESGSHQFRREDGSKSSFWPWSKKTKP